MKIRLLIIFSIIIVLYGCSKHLSYNNAANTKPPKTEVGVFNGNGASPICVSETIEALKIDNEIHAQEVSAADIINGKLQSLDVFIFPGGSGSQQFNNLGYKAAELVKEFCFVQGKGLVGICAGGYLMANTPDYPGLKVFDSPHTRENYDRGRGLISFNLNKKGKEIFYELKDYDSLCVQYYDGPIFEIKNDSKINVLGEINTDIAIKKDDPRDYTPGKPSFLTMDYGKGKVFVSVGHPEATSGMRWMVPRMVRYVAGKELKSYKPFLVRPEINDHEILFYSDTKKKENDLWWSLSSENDSVVIKSIKDLNDIRSRPSIRWTIGLLRHKSFPVRLAAAHYLLDTEYTFAISDIKAAADSEKDINNKAELFNIYKKLKELIAEE
jgi:glutamine amidotransferase-like uncharacterized protein